jgi:hypothetical protein
MLCYVYTIVVAVGAGAVFAIPFALNYNLVNFFLFGISWIIIWVIWSYNGCVTLHYFPGYFFIICYYLKQRLDSIRIRLNTIRNKSKNEKTLIIRRLLEDYNDLCQKIYDYNKYWKKFLTISYLILLSIVCFLTYIVFITPGVKLILRIEYAIVFLGHLMIIFIITYSAASVSHFNPILYKNFCSFNVENCLPIDIKIKVKFF